MVYHPKQRCVEARILTPAGWVTGEFNIPQSIMLLDFLNRNQVFAPLTNVTLENFGRNAPFFMMNRRSVILVVPSVEESRLQCPGPGEAITLKIHCLLAMGVLHGSLELLRNIRVSDFFVNRQGFVLLRDCSLMIRDRSQEMVEIPYHCAMINAEHILGVSDNPPEAGADGITATPAPAVSIPGGP